MFWVNIFGGQQFGGAQFLGVNIFWWGIFCWGVNKFWGSNFVGGQFVGVSNGSQFGPSRVHALPLAAGIFRYIIPLLLVGVGGVLPPLFKTPEGVVVVFQIFAWAPNY
jgi:hypothetical protein